MPRNNLYLVGFMGTGKTTIGRELAKVMGRKFLDTDQVLEKRFGKSVNQIFADEGEKVFRDAERALALELAETENKVVGTGGGTIMDPISLEAFQKSGLLLRLYTRETNLINRLKRTSKKPTTPGARPLSCWRKARARVTPRRWKRKRW